MTFRNNLYYINAVNRTENGVVFTIDLNAEHIIYKAHFPGDPITPGVCILQMGLEMLSAAVERELEIESVKNVKFLSILHPDGASVTVEVHRIITDGDTVKAQVDFTIKDLPVAKMSLICRTVVK